MNASTHRPVTIAAAVAKAAREAIREEFYAELPTAYVSAVNAPSLVTVLVWRMGSDRAVGFGWDGQWKASHDGSIGTGPTVHAALADLARCGDSQAAAVAGFLADCG